MNIGVNLVCNHDLNIFVKILTISLELSFLLNRKVINFIKSFHNEWIRVCIFVGKIF
jgi:hypothetical protein